MGVVYISSIIILICIVLLLLVCVLNAIRCLELILKELKKNNEILSEFAIDSIDLLTKEPKYKGE